MEIPLRLAAGWLIDGTGSPPKRDVLVCVENGVIASVASGGGGEPDPRDPLVTDLARCTVLPGLVDCHVHLAMSGTEDAQIRRRQLCLPYDEAVPLIRERLLEHLACGIVAVRDGGDGAAHTLRYRIERLPCPDLPVAVKSPGTAWHSPDRYGKLIGKAPGEGVSLAECISTSSAAADHVKIVNSGLNSLREFGRETPPQFGCEELARAVAAARKGGWTTMVHANGNVPVRLAVEAGCDSIEHGFFMGSENLERMAERQTYWVPTAFTMKAFAAQALSGSREAEVSRKNLDHQLEQLRRARELGVPVATGTDAGGPGIHHGKALAEELKLFMEAGFSIQDAIRCAALNGARLLGIESVVGEVKAGRAATFLVVPGPPDALPGSLRHVERVYVLGTRVK